MAASQFVGTGVFITTCSNPKPFMSPGQRFKLNDSYVVSVGATGSITLSRSGTKLSGPWTQSQFQQLWQDVAAVGFNIVKG